MVRWCLMSQHLPESHSNITVATEMFASGIVIVRQGCNPNKDTPLPPPALPCPTFNIDHIVLFESPIR